MVRRGAETLPNGLCHINGGQKDQDVARSSIFLHGAIAKDVDWQWLQERALTRQAKQSQLRGGLRARAARSGRLRVAGHGAPSQEKLGAGPHRRLERGASVPREAKRKPYDEVFLMGFSSGAYFVSSLALRGRVKFDGYASFAGGAGGAGRARRPVQGAGLRRRLRRRRSTDRGALTCVRRGAGRAWLPNRVDEQQRRPHVLRRPRRARGYHVPPQRRRNRARRTGVAANHFSARRDRAPTTARSTLWEVGTRSFVAPTRTLQRRRLARSRVDEPLGVRFEEMVRLGKTFLDGRESAMTP